jgi:hypothetical protein
MERKYSFHELILHKAIPTYYLFLKDDIFSKCHLLLQQVEEDKGGKNE